MKLLNSLLSIVTATAWISISEFARNEFLVKSFWIQHYQRLGLVFPSEPLNGAVWGIWSLLFAVFIFFLAKKFSLFQTTLFAWLAGFVMMWVVAGNLGVLPPGMLWIAVPLSILEAYIAALIISAFDRKTRSGREQSR